jgi:hypothetical protein
VAPFQNCVRQPLPPFKMAAVSKNRNFFNCPLLLYYKSNDHKIALSLILVLSFSYMYIGMSEGQWIGLISLMRPICLYQKIYIDLILNNNRYVYMVAFKICSLHYDGGSYGYSDFFHQKSDFDVN